MNSTESMRLSGLALDVSSGELTFSGNPVNSHHVLQLLDADIEFKIESPSILSLQTLYRLLKRYPLLQHINALASDFMEQGGALKPKLGLVSAKPLEADMGEAPEPVRLNLVKITTVNRSDLSFLEQVQMGEPTETLTGLFIANYQMIFEDKPSIDVGVDVSLTAHLEDGVPQACVGDYFVEQLFHKPINILPGRIADYFFPANGDRLAPNYDAVQETVTQLDNSDLTLADFVHTCLSLNYHSAQERAAMKAEQSEQQKFFDRINRLVGQHIEELERKPD
ncbi:hypothetical protein [Pseudomonas sp. CFBP 13719]|uniref:hypothetical protein n=1 Tax=Pseudomonas sp. CFBP 13719 TaxID=2775303 RepID=UPI00177CFC50|nr:hypothetical protein [Pseudomonas sp. CFBP 13719]MBD8681232.1 hypothetical protein [Pseudomonas sp. CFBP 13719]